MHVSMEVRETYQQKTHILNDDIFKTLVGGGGEEKCDVLES